MSNKYREKIAQSWSAMKHSVNNNLLLFSIVLVGFAVIGNLYISHAAVHTLTLNTEIPSHHYLEPNFPLKYAANWDGSDYIHIANDGYTTGFYTGFFPVYPLLIKLVNYLIPSAIMSGLIISWLCLVGAVFYYIKLVLEFCKNLKKNTKNSELLKAAVFFLLYPSGVYFLSVYTESLFALLSLAAVYYAHKKKYTLSAVLISIACATHVTGVFVLALLLLMMLEDKIKLSRIISYAVLGSLGLLGYMAYLWKYFNNPLQFLAAQKQHHWLEKGLWSNLSLMSVLDVVLITLLITSAIYWWKRRKSFSVYSLAFLSIPLLGGQFGGFPRYTMLAFPMTLMIYEYLQNKETLQLLVSIMFGALWALIAILFSVGYVFN